jgi:hypothetical protein
MGLEVIDAQPPSRSTVESVGARGRWRTRGTYTLEELAEGGTRNHLRARVAADAAERTFDSAAHPRSGASQQREVARRLAEQLANQRHRHSHGPAVGSSCETTLSAGTAC